ncbi:ECF subfamily RNA polymerase sigma-24 subunit [Thermincola ferriacetica]|uniref:ECF subfamily RNA polymerase sigma-24 subunit n=1 Tax=Thermincola ferriacetica TaxID=281456 RepID=A0A0L6W5L6_9FIRM|nr:sigma-70 family RNA polymerase sigma factor [Thermincola ferriacetica]KNZ70384.1 ECF subfamily RNA polymerase sigma-24 subunit [Thermincola ferriacetica]
MCLSDEVLIAQSKEGDVEAFTKLVAKYENKVYTIAYRFFGNHADASDIAQEAFIRVYKSLHSFRGNSAFLTWMYRVVTNVCKDELRKRAREKTVFIEELMDNKKGSAMRKEGSISKLPEDAVIRKEWQQEVQEILNSLSVEHRTVIIMRDIQGFSYEEIASMLQCSPGTVKSRLNRARHALKEKLLVRQELLDGISCSK